ncbi:MAG: glycosyltransferase, partial [Eubacteriales bacterium]
MDKNKPKVTLLMATYNPEMSWLKEQLVSLNEQSYENLSLLVLDDASPDVDFKAIKKMVSETITAFDFEVIQNKSNLGSCKTFERLTELGEGDIFAYCDQDDIWEKEKISRLIDLFEPNATLIYSDLCIINGDGVKTHDSLRDIRKRLKHLSGKGLAPKILFRNFVNGCTMLVRANIAKASIPFTAEMIGDHHITLYAASKGQIQYLREPLVRYRQHEGNVSGIMKGVTDKKSYIDVRIKPLIDEFETLKKVTFA